MIEALKQPKIQRIALTLLLLGVYALLIATVARTAAVERPVFFRVTEAETEEARLVVDLVLHPPTLEEEGGPSLEIHELRYAASARTGEAAPDTVCIDSFSVSILVPRLDGFIENQVTGADYPICFELASPAAAATAGDGTTPFDMRITGEAGVLTSDLFMPSVLAGWNPLWYPYDRLDLGLELVADYRVLATVRL
jgi:hypothetical protein